MNRFVFALMCAVVLAVSGCCCHQPCGGSPCGPCGGYGMGYGAGYGTGFAPAMSPYGGSCPGGNCGPYPGAYLGGTTTAYMPHAPLTTAYIEPLPSL